MRILNIESCYGNKFYIVIEPVLCDALYVLCATKVHDGKGCLMIVNFRIFK